MRFTGLVTSVITGLVIGLVSVLIINAVTSVITGLVPGLIKRLVIRSVNRPVTATIAASITDEKIVNLSMNEIEEKQSDKKYFISAGLKKKCYYLHISPFKLFKIIVVSKVNRNVLHRYTFAAQTPDELAEVVADLMSMPPKSTQTDTLLAMVQNLFKGIESMVNKGYGWSEIADRFVELYPDAPVAPGTLRNYWYKLRADGQVSKKPSRRSSSNPSSSLKRSSPKVIPPTLSPPKSEKLEVIPLPEAQPLDSIVDSIGPIIEPQATSVPDGYWSQEEMEGYFNNY